MCHQKQYENTYVKGRLLLWVWSVKVAEQKEIEAGDERKEVSGEVGDILDPIFIDGSISFVLENSSCYSRSHYNQMIAFQIDSLMDVSFYLNYNNQIVNYSFRWFKICTQMEQH